MTSPPTFLLYQITDTPLVTEQLNDITVFPDGIRVVWTTDDDGFDQRNVKATRFHFLRALTTGRQSSPTPDITANATMPWGAAINFMDGVLGWSDG